MDGLVEGRISRRSLVQAGAAIGGAVLATPGLVAQGLIPKTLQGSSETLAATLFKSLTQDQRRIVTFPFDHPLRHVVSNNWSVAPATIASLFDQDQQEMVRQIFIGLHSPDYAEMVMRQVVDDNGGRGFGASNIGFFGQPGSGKFELVITSGHCTRRCDGDSVEGTAFGGPIFYGHRRMGPFGDRADHDGNVYWYQARQAHKLFATLDGKQRNLAMAEMPRAEIGLDTVKLQGRTSGLAGIPMTELSSDQKAEVRKTLAALLAPFRKSDADEAMKLIEAHSLDHLHMAFFRQGGMDKDGAWNIWQIEGPTMVWLFRGTPHVHVWANVRQSATI
jgi:hypothetical protein